MTATRASGAPRSTIRRARRRQSAHGSTAASGTMSATGPLVRTPSPMAAHATALQ